MRAWLLLVCVVACAARPKIVHHTIERVYSKHRIGCARCGCADVNTTKGFQCYFAMDWWRLDERSCEDDIENSCQADLLLKYSGARSYDAPYLYIQKHRCGPLTRLGDAGEYAQLSSGVYKRVDGTNPLEYMPHSAPLAPQVNFVGEFAAMNDPNNTYTNYTCAHRYCRMVQVYRNGSGYACDGGALDEEGTCYVRNTERNDSLPLCHNSSASACAFWTEAEFDWNTAVPELVVLAVVIIFVVVYSFVFRPTLGEVAILRVGVVIAMTVGGVIGIIAAGQMLDFLANTQVDREYISYQGCRRHCDTQSYYSSKFAKSNQCKDNNTECLSSSDSSTRMELEYCYSCQAHRGAYVWLEYASYAVQAKVWFYAALCLACLLLDKWMGHASYLVVCLLAVCNAVLSLVMAGYLTEAGQRQVMRYALTMDGDSLYSLLISASILEISGALGLANWMQSDAFDARLRERANQKANYNALQNVPIEPRDLKQAS